MVRALSKTYNVKVHGKRFTISKEEIKLRNLALVLEHKTASPERRGAILGEYFELNKSFVTYFPSFYGSYRDEIVSIFLLMIPHAFDMFDNTKHVDVNSYLAMYYKKHAVREFLYQEPTVSYNKFIRDGQGNCEVIKAQVISLDQTFPHDEDSGDTTWAFNSNGAEACALEDSSNCGIDRFGEAGIEELKAQFAPDAAQILQDLADQYTWQETMKRSELSEDKFWTLMLAIRIQLTRIFHREGRDVKYLRREDRRKRPRPARSTPSDAPGSLARLINGDAEYQGPDWSGVPDPESEGFDAHDGSETTRFEDPREKDPYAGWG